jgi:hypothetical protein
VKHIPDLVPFMLPPIIIGQRVPHRLREPARAINRASLPNIGPPTAIPRRTRPTTALPAIQNPTLISRRGRRGPVYAPPQKRPRQMLKASGATNPTGSILALLPHKPIHAFAVPPIGKPTLISRRKRTGLPTLPRSGQTLEASETVGKSVLPKPIDAFAVPRIGKPNLISRRESVYFSPEQSPKASQTTNGLLPYIGREALPERRKRVQVEVSKPQPRQTPEASETVGKTELPSVRQAPQPTKPARSMWRGLWGKASKNDGLLPHISRAARRERVQVEVSKPQPSQTPEASEAVGKSQLSLSVSQAPQPAKPARSMWRSLWGKASKNDGLPYIGRAALPARRKRVQVEVSKPTRSFWQGLWARTGPRKVWDAFDDSDPRSFHYQPPGKAGRVAGRTGFNRNDNSNSSVYPNETLPRSDGTGTGKRAEGRSWWDSFADSDPRSFHYQPKGKPGKVAGQRGWNDDSSVFYDERIRNPERSGEMERASHSAFAGSDPKSGAPVFSNKRANATLPSRSVWDAFADSDPRSFHYKPHRDIPAVIPSIWATKTRNGGTMQPQRAVERRLLPVPSPPEALNTPDLLKMAEAEKLLIPKKLAAIKKLDKLLDATLNAP